MATHPRSLSVSPLIANHLLHTTSLILETVAVFLATYEYVNGSPFTVKHLLRFLISFLKYLPVAFSGWLTRSKHRLIYLYYGFCLLSLWLLNQFNEGLNDPRSHLVLQVVLVSLLTCIVRSRSSDSLVESNIYSQIVQYIFNRDNQLSVSRSCELEREDLFGLPEDLFTEIFKKLAFHDFALCSTVCKRGRSYCLNLKWSLYPPHPWSIHFQGQNIMEHLDDGRYVLEQWEMGGRYYYGWVNGWILSIGSEHISIFNLFSRTETNLPTLSRVGYLRITEPSDWYRYIQKFILFKACHDDNLQFLVVALFGPRGFIAFTGPQFQDWICIESDDIACCSDVVLFQGQFYALCGRGKLFLCAFHRSNPCVSLVSEQPVGSFRADKYYLVKNVDHLIAVFQDRNWDSGVKRFGTKTFSIYRTDDDMDWTRIREPIYLVGRTLFISNGNSWIINPAKVKSCRTNSIYFVDDYWFSSNRVGHFIGVFDIANGKIEDFEFEMDQYPPNDVSPFSLTYNVGA